jgi:hypothetical protein
MLSGNAACPSFTCNLQTLQTLILAYHPVIVMETAEEERVQALVKGALQEMGMGLLEWSATHGLSKSYAPGENRWVNECAPVGQQRPSSFDNTTDAAGLLQHMQDTSNKGVYLLKDFTAHLDDPKIVRQFREVVQLFSQTKSTIILVGDPIELPATVKTDAVYFDLHLPGLDEGKASDSGNGRPRRLAEIGAGIERDDLKAGAADCRPGIDRRWPMGDSGCRSDPGSESPNHSERRDFGIFARG